MILALLSGEARGRGAGQMANQSYLEGRGGQSIGYSPLGTEAKWDRDGPGDPDPDGHTLQNY